MPFPLHKWCRSAMVRVQAFILRTVAICKTSRRLVNEARLHCMNFRLAARDAKPGPATLSKKRYNDDKKLPLSCRTKRCRIFQFLVIPPRAL